MKTTAIAWAAACLLSTTASARTQENAVGLRLIVVATEAEAVDARARIAAGESFATLARDLSLDASSAAGGYIGRLAVADLRDEFREAVENLGAGALSPVFRLGADFALLHALTPSEEAWMAERDAGMEHARNRRYAEAAERFEQALALAEPFGERDARLAASLNDLAEARRLRGDGAGAAPLYRRAVAIWETALGGDHPDVATALNNLAEVYRSDGNPAEAEPLYRRAVTIWEEALGADHPAVATGLNNLGLALHAVRRSDEAEGAFRRALAIWERSDDAASPNVAAVLHNLANLLRARGDDAGASIEAEALLERSLAILEQALGPRHPGLVQGLDNLATLERDRGDDAGAALRYERVLEILWSTGPDAPGVVGMLDALTDLVALGFIRGDGLDAARDTFHETISRFPDPELHVAVAGILLSAGMAEAGESILAAAAVRFPDAWAARFRLGSLYAESGRPGPALDEFRRAVELSATDSARYRALMRIGGVHLDRDDLDAAESAFTSAAALGPDDPGAAVSLGRLHLRRSRWNDAARAFEQAAAMDAAGADAHSLLADAYLRLDRPADARAAAQRGVDLDPSHRRAHYLLGQALIRSDNPDAGRRRLEEYARLESEERARQARVLESVRFGADALDTLAAGNDDDALALLENGIDRFPEAVRLRLALGLAEIRLDRPEAAIAILGRIVEDGLGDDSVIHRNLAAAYAMLGEPALSRRHRALYLERIRVELEAQLPG